jgi:phosphatidylserine decarboxylase
MVSEEFKNIPPPSHSIGHWLPKDRADITRFVKARQAALAAQPEAALEPTIVALQQFVASSTRLTKLSDAMFKQIPPAYINDPTGKPQVPNFNAMCDLLNAIIQSGPGWYDVDDPPTAMGLIGFPINAILDWPMGTLAGYLFFMDDDINSYFKNILNKWGSYLRSGSSKPCLNQQNGWLSPDALTILASKGNNDKDHYTFQQLYVCPNLGDPYFGFATWDDFFTRKLVAKGCHVA